MSFGPVLVNTAFPSRFVCPRVGVGVVVVVVLVVVVVVVVCVFWWWELWSSCCVIALVTRHDRERCCAVTCDVWLKNHSIHLKWQFNLNILVSNKRRKKREKKELPMAQTASDASFGPVSLVITSH